MSEEVKICPQCASKEIHRKKGDWLRFLGNRPSYECENCDYQGSLILEVEKDRLDDAKEAIDNFEGEVSSSPSPSNAEVNKTKFFLGLVFIFLGLVPIFYRTLPGDFFVGIASFFIGLAILRSEIRKR